MNTVAKIGLLISAADDNRRKRLEKIFSSDPGLLVLCDDDLTDPLAVQVIVIDLAQPDASQPNFWVKLHLTYPQARFMAIVQPIIAEAALYTALSAGVFSFIAWADSPACFCRVARETYLGRSRAAPHWVEKAAQRLLESPSKEADNALLVSKLKLEMASRQAELDGQPLPLTPLEFDLLAHLTRNAGRVVTYNELLRKVWKCGRASGGTLNQVRCRIKSLRRKLGSNNRLSIETIRSRGYRMLIDDESGHS